MNKVTMTDEKLKNHLDSLEKDEMCVFVMAEGRLRGALFHATRFVNQIRLQHNLGILETMILGQAAIGGALMIPMMKGEEVSTIRFEGDGSAEGFSIEANSKGKIRGFIFNEHIPVEKPLENWNLKPFLGKGILNVSTIRKGDAEPFTSSVETDSGNIADMLSWYYKQSEQTSTAFNTSIQMDKEGKVIGAGGMFLQVMPSFGGKIEFVLENGKLNPFEATDELLEGVELAFKTCPSLGKWFSEKGDFENLIYGIFREFKPSIALRRKIEFDCPCTKELFINHIKHLPKAELDDIRKTGPDPIEVSCRNCGSVYKIPLSLLA